MPQVFPPFLTIPKESKKTQKRASAASSNNTTRTTTSARPSPRHNSQCNNSQHIHAARNLQRTGLGRLRHQSAGAHGVEVDVSVVAPEELGRRGGEGVDEGGFESVVGTTADLEVFEAERLLVFCGWAAALGLGERACAVLMREPVFAAQGEDCGVGGGVGEVVADYLRARVSRNA